MYVMLRFFLEYYIDATYGQEFSNGITLFSAFSDILRKPRKYSHDIFMWDRYSQYTRRD